MSNDEMETKKAINREENDHTVRNPELVYLKLGICVNVQIKRIVWEEV